MSGVSGVRGKVGQGLTPEVMTRLAAAHGAELLRRAAESHAGSGAAPRRVVIGRDSRTSGPMLRDAVAAGLQSVGCDVVDLGLAPTPTVLLAVRLLGAAGGLVVSASHNPPDWNAAKLVSRRGTFLTREEGLATFAVYERGPARAGWDRLGTVGSFEGMIDRHVERIVRAPGVDPDAVESRRIHVVLDGCGGVGALLVMPVLQALGCRIEAMYTDPDGRFPRPPEPVPANLALLGERVRRSGADVGLGLDPDGDRLALVDSNGRAVGEDVTLALAVERVLDALDLSGGDVPPVVTNLSTSATVEWVALRRGVRVERVPVGEINVVERMLELGSVVGGEGNGGVVLPAVHPTRDAGTAAALVLSLLACSGRTLAEAVAEYPASVIVKEAIQLDAAADPLRDAPWLGVFPGAEVDRQDGVRLTWRERRAWLHVRRSGTEPILRLIAEGASPEEARTLIARARSLFDLPAAPNGSVAAERIRKEA